MTSARTAPLARRGGPAGGAAARRAAAQWPVLAAALVVMVLGAALVGTGALLVGPGRERALDAAAARADGGPAGADLVSVAVGTVQPSQQEPPGARAVIDTVRTTVLDALTPLDASLSTWLSTPPAQLPGAPVRLGYLLDADTAAAHATLVTGRWPTDGCPGDAGCALEVALPRTVADALGLAVGDTLRLGAADVPGTAVTVVGLVDLDGSSAWARDRSTGDSRVPVYGPFLVAPGTLIAADAPVGRLSLVADADLTRGAQALPRIAPRVDGLRGALDRQLGDRLDYVTVRSELPAFLADAQGQLNLTAALVLTAALLVATLAGAALTLLSRLISARRHAETALVTDRGASRWQLVGWAGSESLALAALATAFAVPLAVAGYRLLTGLEPLSAAWTVPGGADPAGASPLVGPVLVVVVAGVALALALVATVLAVRGGARSRRGRPTAGVVARSGVDVLLVALALLGYLQLRAHRPGLDAPDPVLVLAPVLCLVAAAAVALRLLPLVVRAAELAARRGRGLVVPLASWHLARGRATAGVFLTALAAASATFALSFQATWTASQHDQAAAGLGADVVVAADGSPGQGERLVEAANAAEPSATLTVAPATLRTIGLGSRPGGGTLVAIDTTRADTLLRGRLPGAARWSEVTAGLRPERPADMLVVHGASIPLEVTGGVAGLDDLGPAAPTAHLTLVLQGEAGQRVTVQGPDAALDGTSHRTTVTVPDARPASTWGVVAVQVQVSGRHDLPEVGDATLSVSIRVPGSDAPTDPAAGWSAFAAGGSLVSSPRVARSGDELDLTATVTTGILLYGNVAVTLAGFGPTDTVPVVCSTDLAEELGLTEGSRLDLTVGSATLPGRVTGLAPYVPSSPSRGAVLVDIDTLSRALVERGELSTATDQWWLATSDPGAVAAAVGGIARTDVGQELAAGPLRGAGGAALRLLVVTAILLAAAGTAARELAVGHERTLEVARLRGFGASRRLLSATGAVRHTFVTTLSVGMGALAGALLTRVLITVMVTSRDGSSAVPPAAWVWPWPAEAGAIVALLAGCLLAGLAAAGSVTRRAASAGLRMGDTA